jgi:Protein of unknown function (DUF3089)
MAKRTVGSLTVALALAVTLASCGGPTTRVSPPTQPKPDPAGTVWLCRPGQSPDPCMDSLVTTVVEPNGTSHVVHYQFAESPPIDCFYVYPNITHQLTLNANLEVDAQETAIAQLEASPFSQDCRVFAPMYREGTGKGTGAAAATRELGIAYGSVLSAWQDYLTNYNGGRGVVLIGHSEGSYILAQLLTQQIDQVPAVRKRLVSALITGANLPTNRVGLGPLKTIGPCQSSAQLGCVIDFNAYNAVPPSNALFGTFPEPEVDGNAVEDICTNPAGLSGGSGSLVSMYRVQLATQDVAGSTTQGIFGNHPPTVPTPWIEYDGGYTSACVTRNGRNILMVSSTRRFPALVAGSPAWGLHVDDPNLAMGNLVQLVRTEAVSYSQERSRGA